MKALIWREMRALRNPALVVLGVLGLALVVDAPVAGAAPNGFWYVLLPLVGLAMGCWVIARERAGREVEFSNAWPVSRRQVWWAKLIVGLLGVTLVYAIILGAALLLSDRASGFLMGETALGLPRLVIDLIAPTVLLFGLGLLMSTIRPSPFDAAGSAFIAAILLVVALALIFLDFVAQRWGPEIGFWPLSVPGSAGAFIALGSMICVACAVASYVGYTRTRALQFGRRTWLTLGVGAALTVVAIVLTPVGLVVFGEPAAEDIEAILEAQASPDGEWIAFQDLTPAPVYDEEGGREIQWAERSRLWLMRSDGSGLRCIARWPVRLIAEWQHARWLPFAWGPSYGEESIFTQGAWLWAWDMDRMEARVLSHPPRDLSSYLPLSVSPDGRYMLGNVIIRLDDLSADPIPLPRAESHFAGWGEGRAYFDLAKETREALWAVTLPGGGLERIAEAPDTGQWGASVSPDERWIAWSQSQYDGKQWALVLEEIATGVEGRFRGLNSIWQGWSPDGRFVWAREPGEGGLSVLEIGETIGRVRVRLPEGMRWPGGGMYWSPGGERVAVQLQERTEGNLRRRVVLVVNADGTDVREVARTGRVAAGKWQLCGWLADGRVLMLEEHARLVAIEPETGERAVVFEVR